jgi:hypothetical protein
MAVNPRLLGKHAGIKCEEIDMAKCSIKSITIGLPDGDSIELTVEQARDLYAELGKLLGQLNFAVPPVVLRTEYLDVGAGQPDREVEPDPVRNDPPEIWCRMDSR